MVEKKGSLLTIRELLDATGGNLFSGSLSGIFTSVVTDSRNVIKECLFVPLVGELQNGHVYIPAALEKGSSVVFLNRKEVEEKPDTYKSLAQKYHDVCFITVKNTLYALQDAAASYVKKFPSLIRIGITGSCGKTTTKEILSAILSQKYSVIMNEGNLNSETGLPLSVFKIREGHEIGVFEMGMNRTNEILELASVLKPQYAVITNIGTAHIGILGSQNAIAEEKKNIFACFTDDCTGFIPENDKYVDFLAKGVKGKFIKYSGSTFSQIDNCGVDGMKFIYKGESILLPLPGCHNLSNAAASVSVANSIGMASSEIKAGIENIKPLFGRSQTIHIGSVTVLLDCYNANPDSMEKAFELCDGIELSKNYPAAKKIYVIGDMLELGESSKIDHEQVGIRCNVSNADIIICIGREMQYAADCIKNKKVISCAEIDDASIKTVAENLLKLIADGSLILLKASRGIKLERIFEMLEKRLK